MSRRGKIARLLRNICDESVEWLGNGVGGASRVAWLNSLQSSKSSLGNSDLLQNWQIRCLIGTQKTPLTQDGR